MQLCAGEDLEPFSFEDIFDIKYRPRMFYGEWISK